MSETKKSFPSPITILMAVIVVAAATTWILPAGNYAKLDGSDGKTFVFNDSQGEKKLAFSQQTLDSLGIQIPLAKFSGGEIRKAVSVPGTFSKQENKPQGIIQIIQAPLKGIVESIDIILFVLVIGGFSYVFNETGAIIKGISYLSYTMMGSEKWLIIFLTAIFSFLGASYGMAEEALVFYPLLVPVFLAAGYDVLIPLAILFGGTQLGYISSFSNPFSVIIASNAAGINWMDGLYERLILFALTTGVFTWYLLRYAAKIKKNPEASLVLQIEENVKLPYELSSNQNSKNQKLDFRTKLLLVIYGFTFLIMVGGVVFLSWWTLEMSSLFVVASILVALITRMNEKIFLSEFIKGAESLLGVAFIIGVARGVTIILSEGMISDSILFYASSVISGMSPIVFIIILLLFFAFFSLFISSSSGMAVLTMPIIGALAIIVNIPGREIVNAYLYGMGIVGFLSPTGMLLPSLALVNISVKTWVKFIAPLIIILTLICILFLGVGIYL